MTFHKDIIIRIIFGFIFIAFVLRVLGPILMLYLKNKLPGQSPHEGNIDSMIRRQQERLRAQYGLQGDIQNSQHASENKSDSHKIVQPAKTPASKEIQQIYKETKWGAGEFTKVIQLEISKSFSHTFTESKIHSFILLSEKRNYLRHLTEEHQASQTTIKNYLVTVLLYLILLEEIREKKFAILEKIAGKIGIRNQELALAIQIKLLMVINSKKVLKDELIFSEKLILNQFSEETIKEACESIIKKEANLWAKSTSQFFEELSLMLKYASIVSPIPKLKNKKDLETAAEILGISIQQNIDDIKKSYKKIALQKHPDIIVSQKLPIFLEKKAIEQFSKIQEAYEILITHRK